MSMESYHENGQIDAVYSNRTLPSLTHISQRYSRDTPTPINSGVSDRSKFTSYYSTVASMIYDRPSFIIHRSNTLSDYSKSYNVPRLSAPSYLESQYRYTSISGNYELNKYLPQNYIPNIQRSGYNSNSSSSDKSSAADLFDEDEISSDRRHELDVSILSRRSSSSLPSASLTGTVSSFLSQKHQRQSIIGTSLLEKCFMNCVIQCLSNTRPLLEYLLREQYLADINKTSNMKGALIKTFSQLIQELWENDNSHVVNTTSFKSQIQRYAPRFMGYSQQDAQEFLRYLLEGLHEDVNRVIIKPQLIQSDILDNYTNNMQAAESWKRYLRYEDSMIVDVFVGQLRSSLRCSVCDHVSVTLDPFWDLSLPIPYRRGSVKLNQCLEYFTREEVLDGDEKPTCAKCQMKRKCTKCFSIQKFPMILVIHLKRFSPMERFQGKLNILVEFPLIGLDLTAFSAPKVQGCTYNLYGVANHSGTMHAGHYTAYCKHSYSGGWHEYNDSRVIPASVRSIVTSEAYVLFYEQKP